MPTTDLVLRTIQEELEWLAGEPSWNSEDGYSLLLEKVEAWKRFPFSSFTNPGAVAVRIDHELLVTDDVANADVNALVQRNPSIVAVRMVNPADQKRLSLLLTRGDVYPSDSEMAAIGYY
jgi:hypothetical protein